MPKIKEVSHKAQSGVNVIGFECTSCEATVHPTDKACWFCKQPFYAANGNRLI